MLDDGATQDVLSCLAARFRSHHIMPFYRLAVALLLCATSAQAQPKPETAWSSLQLGHGDAEHACNLVVVLLRSSKRRSGRTTATPPNKGSFRTAPTARTIPYRTRIVPTMRQRRPDLRRGTHVGRLRRSTPRVPRANDGRRALDNSGGSQVSGCPGALAMPSAPVGVRPQLLSTYWRSGCLGPPHSTFRITTGDTLVTSQPARPTRCASPSVRAPAVLLATHLLHYGDPPSAPPPPAPPISPPSPPPCNDPTAGRFVPVDHLWTVTSASDGSTSSVLSRRTAESDYDYIEIGGQRYLALVGDVVLQQLVDVDMVLRSLDGQQRLYHLRLAAAASTAGNAAAIADQFLAASTSAGTLRADESESYLYHHKKRALDHHMHSYRRRLSSRGAS